MNTPRHVRRFGDGALVADTDSVGEAHGLASAVRRRTPRNGVEDVVVGYRSVVVVADPSVADLAAARFPDVDEIIVDQCGLRRTELSAACRYLDRITPEIIASAIAVVPQSCGEVGEEDRTALAQYLWDRCETMRS